jgi:polysaccharide biosynthesis/export protein
MLSRLTLCICFAFLASNLLAQRARPERPPSAESAISSTGPVKSMDQLDSTTQINIGDHLSFRIVEDEEQPVSLVVNDAGQVEIPYLGKLQAAHRTPKELAFDAKRALESGLYKKATVLISLDRRTTESPGVIYLSGEVNRQGPLDIPPNERLTVSTAILRAGGFSEFANKRKVRVIRKTPQGEKIYVVDVKQILEKARGDLDLPLTAGDKILVPARMISW